MSVSEKVKTCLMSYLSQLNSSSDEDRQLISDILNAAVEEFENITGPTLNVELVMKKCYVSEVRVAACSTGSSLVQSSEQFLRREKEILGRVKTVLRSLEYFEPAMYRSIKSHFLHQGASKVEFLVKVTGRQAGTVANVHDKDGSTSKLHFIKSTHSFHENGRDLEHYTTDKVEFLDYKELFVYRVLEKLGLGPKVEFIVAPDLTALPTGDKSSVLISSQDISSNEFLFSSLAEILTAEAELLQAGGTECPLKITRHLEALTEKLFSTPAAMGYLKTIDLLCRVLLLDDVLVNNSNFGRVTNAASGEELAWVLVDFRIMHKNQLQADYRPYYVPTLGANFPGVGGRLQYRGLLELRGALLGADSLAGQVKDFLLRARHLKNVLETAREEIESFLIANKDVLCIEEGMHKRKMVDLSAYIDAAWDNVTLA